MAEGGAVGILGALKIIVDADSAKAERVLKSLGGKAELLGTAVGTALGGAGAVALKMGDQWDAMSDDLAASTGKSGADLDKLTGIVQAVAGDVTENIGTIGEAVQILEQKTGDATKGTAESLIDLARVTKTDYATAFQDVTDVYNNWNVAQEDQVAVNDMLLRAYQASGVAIDSLSSDLSANGAIFREMGLDLQDSTALIAAFNKAGIETASVLGPLKKSIANAIKSGEDPKHAIADLFEAIKNAPDDISAGKLALQSFGAKGVQMAQLIREGKLDVQSLFDTIANGSSTVQQVSDDTRDAADGVKEFMNRITSAVGPITSAFAGVSDALGNGIFLLPAAGGFLGRAIVRAGKSGPVKAAISGVAGLFSKGFNAAVDIGSGLASKITSSGAWDSIGNAAGGIWGKAFSLAAVAVIAVIIKDELDQLGKIQAANVASRGNIDQGTKDFLAGMPSKSEVQAKIDSLQHLTDGMDGLNAGLTKVGELGRGNVLGSVFDAAFGENPGAALDDQIDALKAYMAAIPDDVAPVAATAGDQTGTKLATGITDGIAGALPSIPGGVAPAANSAATGVAGAITNAFGTTSGSIHDAVVKPIHGAFVAATKAVAAGFGSVHDALENPPKMRSIGDRLSSQTRNLRRVMAMMRKAVSAGDPFAVRYWDQARAKVQANIARLQGTTQVKLSDIKAAYAKAGISVKGTWAEIASTTKQKSDAAQNAAVGAAQDTKAGIDAVDLYSSGISQANEYANGLRAGIPNVSSAAWALANAAAAPIRANSPPKEGPLREIDTWGPKLVDAWLDPMARKEGKAHQVGARLAGAVAPHAMMGYGSHIGRAGGGGDVVHLHVGTLIANDKGLDELERRMARRQRIRRKDRRIVGTPDSANG